MILSSDPTIDVVGEAADGRQAVTLAHELLPDVVLMDIRMPEIDGIEATRRIVRDVSPPPRIIILTTFDLDEYVYDAIAAGASGFLLKDVPAAQLITGVQTVAAGDALLDPQITRRLIEEFARTRAPRPVHAGFAELTPREHEVFQLLAQGHSNSEIAGVLVLEETTDQDPRHADPEQAAGSRPRPGRHRRLRKRPHRPRPQLVLEGRGALIDRPPQSGVLRVFGDDSRFRQAGASGFHTEYQRGVSDPRTLKEQLVRSGRAHAALVFDREGAAQGWCHYGSPEELGLKHLRRVPQRIHHRLPTGGSPASSSTRGTGAPGSRAPASRARWRRSPPPAAASSRRSRR